MISVLHTPRLLCAAMAYTHAKSYPAEHLQDGEIWPNGTLKDTAPIEAYFSKALAQRLHHARAGRSLKEVAHMAGVSQDAISRLLRGKTWGTIPVIVRIEHALDTQLWDTNHITTPNNQQQPPDNTSADR